MKFCFKLKKSSSEQLLKVELTLNWEEAERKHYQFNNNNTSLAFIESLYLKFKQMKLVDLKQRSSASVCVCVSVYVCVSQGHDT